MSQISHFILRCITLLTLTTLTHTDSLYNSPVILLGFIQVVCSPLYQILCFSLILLATSLLKHEELVYTHSKYDDIQNDLVYRVHVHRYLTSRMRSCSNLVFSSKRSFSLRFSSATLCWCSICFCSANASSN